MLFARCPTVELMELRVDCADISREREVFVFAFDELVRNAFIRLCLYVVPSVLGFTVLCHGIVCLRISVEILAAYLVSYAPTYYIVESAAFEPEFVLFLFLDIGQSKLCLGHFCTALNLVESFLALCGVTASDASLSIKKKSLGIACALGI